jgi:hypothetical protein
MTYISFVLEDTSSSSSSSSSNDTATSQTPASNGQVSRRLADLGVPPSYVQLPAFQLTDLYTAGLYHADGTAPSSDEVKNIKIGIFHCFIVQSFSSCAVSALIKANADVMYA